MSKRIHRHNEKGFTLVELLVVLVILGLLVGIVGPRVVGYLGGAKSKTAKLQIENFAAAMDLYLIDAGSYPAQAQGLDALVNAPAGNENWGGPFLAKQQLPLDPWGNAYLYIIPGEVGAYDIYSFGADGVEGGAGEDSDIRN